MATKTQGLIVSIETARASAKVITAATAVKPVVLTAAAHGYSDLDIILVDSVVGMQQLNNRAFQVDAVAGSPMTSKFGLKGVDGSLYTPYVSGGNAYKCTMTPIGTVTGVPTLFSGTAPFIKTTHLLSVSEEQITGLQTFGSSSFELIFNAVDTAQIAMQTAKENQVPKVFTFKSSDGKVAAYLGYVASFNITAAANEVLRATAEIVVAAAPSLFA